MNGSLRQNVIFHSPASCWQVPALSHPLQLKPSKLTPSTSSAARLSLCALLSHHIYIYFFRFHLLLDLLQWVGGRYGGMPSGEKRQVAFRENYMQLKESSVYTPDCSSWWSEQKTKRGEPSCCSPAALLILSAPSISPTRLGFGLTRSLNRNSTSGQIFSELKRLFLQSMFLTCTFSICGDQRFKPPWY